ncbi:MAG: alpha-L-fucosidase [Ginsengibacter sp.]
MKFGMFIHWGMYSVLGDGEWVMHNENIPYKSYKRLADFFNPKKFNASEWVSLAKKAGMKYITVTARHHDGFSMFKTAATSYNIVDATPYKKDPLLQLAKECQKEGIELHFYYSLLDWGRPDYAFGSKIVDEVPEKGNWPSYIQFMKTQLTELITKYPAVKGIWFDGHWERPNVRWHYDEIYSLIHKLNNDILIGNNHHMAPLNGEDFQMFEKDLPGENTAGFNKESKIGDLPLETCETINNSWGFNIKDTNYKTVKQIIHYLVNASGRNANFLLNVGPMPNGKIQSEFVDTLLKVGKWLKKYGTSIYNTRGDQYKPQPWGVITSKSNSIYCHVLTTVDRSIKITMKRQVQSVMLLNTAKNLSFQMVNNELNIDMPASDIDEIDSIIAIKVK